MPPNAAPVIVPKLVSPDRMVTALTPATVPTWTGMTRPASALEKVEGDVCGVHAARSAAAVNSGTENAGAAIVMKILLLESSLTSVTPAHLSKVSL
jgi:hypothetical protein